jgi:hypothetical protein
MYHYIEDKEFLAKLYRVCSDIVNQLVQQINNDGELLVEAHLVGSGARNMVTQNANEPVDLDYNLRIVNTYGMDIHDGRCLKEYIRKHFNIVLNRNGWEDCGDSTSALTTEKRHFTKGNKTEFSIDLAIVRKQGDGWFRLIHHKTGFVYFDQWYWNEAPHSTGLSKRVNTLKRNNLWLEVREVYLRKKNAYLCTQDPYHPSFISYIEAVNEVYYKYFH